MNQSSGIGMIGMIGTIDTINTFTQQGTKLVGSDASGNYRSMQGISVSVYGDTLAVGGYRDNNGIGATWIFTRTEGVWTQQGPKLVGSGGIGRQSQGFSVSLYGDTLAVGGPADNNSTGATWIFTRTNGVWIQQGSKLVGSGTSANFVRTSANEVRTSTSANEVRTSTSTSANEVRTNGSQQGYSVSLYGDTLAVGGPADNNFTGATWIFTRTNGVWTQQGSKLIGSDTSANEVRTSANEVRTRASANEVRTSTSVNEVRTNGSEQGISVSLYGDTLAVGGPDDNNNIGAIWIFTRTNGVWTQQGSKLVGSGTNGKSYQGSSVSLYGNTLAVGGYRDNNGIGATWIFTRNEGIWTQQGAKLVGSGTSANFVRTSANEVRTSGTDGSYQGYSVSIYGDMLAVGGTADNNYTGATWIFTRNEGVWTQQGSKLIGSGGSGFQGSSVSLYGDMLAVGGIRDNNDIGATWIFQNIIYGIAK